MIRYLRRHIRFSSHARHITATRPQPTTWRSQRGTVLLSVLIILAIAMTIVVAMTASSSQVFKSVSTLQHQYQSSIYSRTIINALSAAFQLDTNNHDSADDIWTSLPPLPAEDNSIISATILPLNSRISLNDIFSTDPLLKQRVRNSIEQLVADMEGNVNFIDELYLWGEGKDTDKPLYTNQKTYSNTGKPFTTLAEIRLLPSITPELYDKISENFNVGTKGSQLNINFASQYTMELLLPELSIYIEQWIEYRNENGGIPNISQLQEVANIPTDLYSQNIRYLSVNSNNFYVKLSISRSGVNENFHMLVRRDLSSRSISLQRYIEGNNEHYF